MERIFVKNHKELATEMAKLGFANDFKPALPFQVGDTIIEWEPLEYIPGFEDSYEELIDMLKDSDPYEWYVDENGLLHASDEAIEWANETAVF